jgi:hypothetical protein
MRNLFHGAIAAAMMSIFALMFWAQVGSVMATALAVGRSDPSVTKAGSCLSIQRLEPVY